MRALCVGRHRFLSDHLGRVFGDLGVETTCVVGVEGVLDVAPAARPDVVICDYDLLRSLPRRRSESEGVRSRPPVIAVSLTRRADDAQLPDVDGIAGFLYLPTLRPADAWRVLTDATRSTYATFPTSLDRPRAEGAAAP